jgi:hypothetical protein
LFALLLFPPLDHLAQERKFQHLAPTVRATKKPPAMAPKRASSKAAPSVDEAAKAALLAEKKGKALADTTHQEACEDDALSKRQRNDQPTPEGTLHTCSSGGQPQPPPGFAPLEGRTPLRTAKSSAFQQKNSCSCRPYASRTEPPEAERSSRSSASVSPCRPRCAR